ncbi:hypothetical protein P8452_61590 [Trifolium repens]|nr:hypothetical protein P8452_61590 [Trifolium repens]
MADFFVSDVAASLTVKLASYAYEEAFKAYDLLDEFELQDKLKEIEKASGSTRVKVRHFFSSSNQFTFRFKMFYWKSYNRGGGVTRRLSILKMMKLCKRHMRSLKGHKRKQNSS